MNSEFLENTVVPQTVSKSKQTKYPVRLMVKLGWLIFNIWIINKNSKTVWYFKTRNILLKYPKYLII